MVETEDYLSAVIAIAGCFCKARTRFEPYRVPSGHWVKARRTFRCFKLLKPFFHMSQPCVEFHGSVRSGDVRDHTELSQHGWWSAGRNGVLFNDLWPFDLQYKQQHYIYTWTGSTLCNRSLEFSTVFRELLPFSSFCVRDRVLFFHLKTFSSITDATRCTILEFQPLW